GRFCYHLLWLRQRLTFDARAIVATVGRWQLVQVGVGVELADQAQPAVLLAASPGTEACQFVRGVVAVACQHEGPLPEPAQQHTAELSQQVVWCLVPASSLLVVLLAAIQGDQQWQGPLPLCEGEADQHAQHHPLVTPAEGGERVRGADRVSMASFAEDLVARVLIDGVVTSQKDATFRHEMVEDPAGQAPGQLPGRPAAFAEDAMVTGGMARRQGAEGAQQFADVASADGQDGSQSQGDEAKESGSSKGTSQRVEEGASRLGHSLVDVLKFTASCSGLACHTATAFEITASRLGTTLAAGAAGVRGWAATGGSGYTGHGSLLDVNAGRYLHCTKKAPSLPGCSKWAEVELSRFHSRSDSVAGPRPGALIRTRTEAEQFRAHRHSPSVPRVGPTKPE